MEGEDIVSIWLPLDPVPRASCLEFLRGSHLHGHEYAPVKIGDGTRYEGSVGMPAIPPLEEVRSGRLDDRMPSTDLQPRQPAPVLRAWGLREQERRSEPAPPILNWELELGDCLVFVRHSKTPLACGCWALRQRL